MTLPPLFPRSISLALLLFVALALRQTSAENSYIWIGNVTSSSFTVHIDISTVPVFSTTSLSTAQLLVGESVPFSTTIFPDTLLDFKPVGSPFPSPHENIRVYYASNLSPGTLYRFGYLPKSVLGSVVTFPTAAACEEVLFAVSSCHYFTSLTGAWSQISKLPQGTATRATLMLHGGDLHYSNIETNSPRLYFDATSEVVRHEVINDVFSTMPVAYIYDDHDSGGDNANGDSASVPAVLDNYRRMVPHAVANASFADSQPPSYHAFTVASVRVVITDLRTESSRSQQRLMSERQLDWFLRELGGAAKFKVVVWLSSRPYISKDGTEEDDWGGMAPGQRSTIADYISEKKIDNLVLVSGDMHALAADSGKHSDYSKSGGAGFPVFHCGPLGNVGSTKGGPYTEGCKSTRLIPVQQYATVRLSKLLSSDGPCVSYKGFIGGSDKPAISFDKCGTLGGVKGLRGGGQGPMCSIKLLPWWGWLILAVIIILILSGCVCFCWCCKRCVRRRRKAKGRGDFGESGGEKGHSEEGYSGEDVSLATDCATVFDGGSVAKHPPSVARRRSRQEVEVE